MIDQAEFYHRYVIPFEKTDLLYEPARGFIVWRLGSGSNVELLHIAAAEIRKGHGRWLFYHMLDRLEAKPPYHSVFGFTAVSNKRALAFYDALGFEHQEVHGLYQTGPAALFWQSYEKLRQLQYEYQSSHRLGP